MCGQGGYEVGMNFQIGGGIWIIFVLYLLIPSFHAICSKD